MASADTTSAFAPDAGATGAYTLTPAGTFPMEAIKRVPLVANPVWVPNIAELTKPLSE